MPRPYTTRLEAMRQLISIVLIAILCGCSGPAPAATPTAAPGATPQVRGRPCGIIVMLGPNAPGDPLALPAETCFAQAYQQCTTATLIVRVMGVDSGVLHTLTIENVNGKCTVSDNSLSYNVSLRSEVNKTVQCAGVEQSASGLVIKACGDTGDLLVPAPQS